MSNAENVSKNEPFQLSMDGIHTLFLQRRCDEISEQFLRILETYNTGPALSGLNAEQLFAINQFVKLFLYIMSEPGFVMAERFWLPFFSFNHLISNLVAISWQRNTDAYVQILLQQPDNAAKLLTLINARNRVQIDRRQLFDLNPALASVWFSFYACSYYSSLVSEVGWENLRRHFNFVDRRLRIQHQIQETYFGSTYAGGDCDRLMKPIVNQTVREFVAGVTIRQGKTDSRKIAVASLFWSPGSSVYRILAAMVKSLKPDFHLTFIQMSDAPPPDREMWDDVKRISSSANALKLDELQDNDFQVVLFPDVGMSDGSILLANMRIAPIQVLALGHPVSTYGGEIDYVMSGADIESPVHPEEKYSERVVLLPGMGLTHSIPNYQRKWVHASNPVCTINLPAWCQKINYPYVQTLKKIQSSARSRSRIRLFSGNSLLRSQDFLPFSISIAEQLGPENVEIVPPLAYETYMTELERGDLALDAFHFGGGNTVSDNLFVGVPMLCWEGDKWYNRIGPAALRVAGLEELIATDEAQFIERAIRLIDDVEYRNEMRRKLSALDLTNTVYASGDAKYFNDAMHYVIDNHERLRTSPERVIRIPR